MQPINRREVLSGLIWRYAERCGAQGIQFIVSIVLARLLTPSDYGLVGLITVFLSIAQVFAQSGLGQALVQKKNADNIDFSTVLYYSIAFSIILYIILFICSPPLAAFYNAPELTAVIRVLSLTVIIGAINSVQQAYVQKTMQFKRFFFATLGGTLVSAVVGICMAFKGFGIWALVAQQLTNQTIDTIILWLSVKWRPILAFSVARMKQLFSYGWKILATSLINNIYFNIFTLVIGKVFSSSDLGYYNRGEQFPKVIETNIDSAVEGVLFPVMSEVQDDKVRLKSMVRRFISSSTFAVFPIMAGLAAIARPFVIILLTDKWLPAVAFIQFNCFIKAFMPIFKANLQAINAVGRSDIFLKLEIIKRTIGILILIVTLPFGLYAMMFGRCTECVLDLIIDAFPNKKILGYSFLEQIRDILPAFVLSLLMCIGVLCVSFLNFNAFITIIIQLIIGIVIYIGGALLFKLDGLSYVYNTIRDFVKKR